MKTHARALGPHPAYPPRASVHKVVSWCVPHPSYAPVLFTHPSVLGAAWADKEFATMTAQERVQLSDRPSKVGRQSSRKVSTLAWMGFVHKSGVPRNPVGRTGMHGRGLLGRYGANFAADPIVTRRKPTDPTVLQMVTITRRDTGELAIPGGMVEYDETVNQTLRKEFYEEALRSEDSTISQGSFDVRFERDPYPFAVVEFARDRGDLVWLVAGSPSWSGVCGAVRINLTRACVCVRLKRAEWQSVRRSAEW